MSIFYSTDVVTNQSSFLNYYLVNMPFYQSDISCNMNSGYYSVLYNYSNNNSSNNYNVIYYNTKDFYPNYNANQLFLYKLIHNNVAGVTDGGKGAIPNLIGELVIQTVNMVDQTPLFLCFLIRSVSGQATDDVNGQSAGSLSNLYNKIIYNGNNGIQYDTTGSKAVTISPSSDGTIPSQDTNGCIIYYDSGSGSIVVLFLTPITVSNPAVISFIANALTNKTHLFSKYPTGGKTDILSEQSVVYKNEIANLFTASADPNATVTTATGATGATSSDGGTAPTSGVPLVNDNQIYIDCNPTGASEDAIMTYQIPINSDLMSDIQNSSFAKLCSNFALFGIILLAAYIGIPQLYETIVLNRMHEADDVMYSKYFIVAYFMLVATVLFISGNRLNNMIEMVAGFFMVFLAILTYILISNEESKSNRVFDDFNVGNFFRFAGSVVQFLAKNCLPIIGVLWAILFVIMTVLLFTKNSDGKTIVDKQQYWAFGFWLGIVAIPTVVGLVKAAS